MISIFIYSYGGYLFSFVFLAFVCSMVFALHRQGKEVDSSPKILLKIQCMVLINLHAFRNMG